MNEDESMRRYGLRPVGADLDDVRELLKDHTERERRSQGAGDTELMKLCCVQLFNAGVIDDVLLIWSAKAASMDAACSIDVQLLCGGGLTETKAYLSALRTPEAEAARQRLLECEEAGDFEDFCVEDRSAQYADYYE
ncbi:hypothetical protein [Streptomyces sp. CAI-85]|uniref:hypothetical protein n=1 Tax=Streptomyces sp. CAI-85 TaxID=1472662 RepID=UPI00158772D3|nr:hypothetical protein [Streptomyces sp. CAI-85]NUV62469.1 hypothetical protein [Streptomyces sp. CAI-85]